MYNETMVFDEVQNSWLHSLLCHWTKRPKETRRIAFRFETIYRWFSTSLIWLNRRHIENTKGHWLIVVWINKKMSEFCKNLCVCLLLYQISCSAWNLCKLKEISQTFRPICTSVMYAHSKVILQKILCYFERYGGYFARRTFLPLLGNCKASIVKNFN